VEEGPKVQGGKPTVIKSKFGADTCGEFGDAPAVRVRPRPTPPEHDEERLRRHLFLRLRATREGSVRVSVAKVRCAVGRVGTFVGGAFCLTAGVDVPPVARAFEGNGEGRVIVRHALRNSLIPFMSALSLEVGAVVGASLAADWVFSMGDVAA
jgi:hypothetical protein